jgi:peptide/nickel transport system substrate-binding protein
MRRPTTTAPAVTLPKREWLVGWAFLLLIIAGVAYFALKNADTPQSTSRNFTGPIKQGGTVNFAAGSELTGFNINTAKDNSTSLNNIVINLYPQVFHVQPDFTVKLDEHFMESAEQTSSDPQTIVYKIKQNAIWSDGTPVSADDFNYLWKNLNGTIKSNDISWSTGYDQIKSVTGSDNGKTVTVVFKTPFTDWKGLFTGILPSHYVKKQPGGWNTGLDKNPEKIPSAGPFLVANYTPGQSLTLARNDKYFGPKAHLDSIVYRFLPESTTQAAALQSNEVDLIYPQPQLDQVQQVKSLPNVTTEINFGLTFEHLTFNFKNVHLKNLKVRQAIATGLNAQELVAQTVGQFSDKAEPLGNRIWLTGQPQYQDHLLRRYGKGDVAGAQKLLEEGGYSKGGDAIYSKGGEKLSLRISTTAGNRLRETQEHLFQAQMKEVGIDIKIANLDSIKFFSETLPNGNFDIANFGWIGSPFTISSNHDIYRTDGFSNYGHYSNPKTDALFKQAISELDQAKATEFGNRIDQQLTADMATIPLYTKPTFLAYRSGLVNIIDNPNTEGLFWNAGSWGYKA